jgi:HD superfamily phosphohydrolase
MEFDKLLVGKILDPIHGIIRLSEIELQFIDHPLFQRLRNIKQNTFLYKVFPSAMHSRFEHSLGVMHLSYEMIKNISLNSYRYKSKYSDGHVFDKLEMIPDCNIQELRLAALLHDIGHGPMSHQFDSFMCYKEELFKHIGDEFPSVFNMIKNGNKVEHEHMSLIFVNIIYNSLSDEFRSNININNVMYIIESEYCKKEITVDFNGVKYDILPIFTSIISSCPIDADRMDYLLRDSYFTGVKCGIYDYNRLFMSIVPVVCNEKIYLSYKESGLDSIVEFISARSSLFGQVYYHKTNRSFSAMLSKVCDIAKNQKGTDEFNLFTIDEPDAVNNDSKTQQLVDFYITNSDDYFLNEQLPSFIVNSELSNVGEELINHIIERKPWPKVYEYKYYPTGKKIKDKADSDLINNTKIEISTLLNKTMLKDDYIIDIVTDNSFKDISKSQVKLLKKKPCGEYEICDFEDCGDKLDQFQSIKYIIRIFTSESNKDKFTQSIIDNIENINKEKMI